MPPSLGLQVVAGAQLHLFDRGPTMSPSGAPPLGRIVDQKSNKILREVE